MKSSPLHIVFFNRAFTPEVSATSQLLTELAEGLARDYGCRVSVIAGMPQGEVQGIWRPPRGWWPMMREQMGPITVLRARGTTWPKRFFLGRVINYLTYFGSACLVGLRLKDPDVIVALTDPPIIGLAALLSARLFCCPLVISFRDIFPEAGQLLGNVRRPLIDWFLHKVNRILFRHASHLIALGEAMRSLLIRKGADPSKVTVIPDWADCSTIVPGEKRNPFSLSHGLADRFVVMHAGNIGVSQNLEVLLEAAALLEDLPDLSVVFVGDGVNRQALKSEAERRALTQVRFLPYQPRESLSQTFATADLFIVSVKPGLAGVLMPSKLYGILASGRPYVAAVDEQCDVARITCHYGCGLLVSPGDARDLAEKIRLLYHDRALTQNLGTRAREAAQAFDRSRGVRAYFDLCLHLATQGAQGRPFEADSQSFKSPLHSSESSVLQASGLLT